MTWRRSGFLLGLALRNDFDGVGGDLGVLGGDEGQVGREVLEVDVAILNFHSGADVDLDGEEALEGAVLFVEVDNVHGGVAVDPMLVVVAADEDAEVVPLAGGEFFCGELLNDPGLTFLVDDHLLAGVRQNAAAAFFIEHAVVVGAIGDHVALIAGDDPVAEVGPVCAAIVDAAVAAGRDFHLKAEVEILKRAAAPDDKAVVFERAIGDAGEATVFDGPIVGTAFPVGEFLAVENRTEAFGRRCWLG